MTTSRRAAARQLRYDNADSRYVEPHPEQLSNGEDSEYRNKIASFTKGLPHDQDPESPTFGEVLPEAYATLARALCSARPSEFERVTLSGSVAGGGSSRKLTNPQGGLAYDVEGIDPEAVTIPPAPRIDSAEVAGEMAELYWMALCRDVNFRDFADDPLVAEACTELDGLADFGEPRPVAAGSVFRGFTDGDLRGPYVSQFLLHDVQFGTIRYRQLQRTKKAGTDYGVTPEDWVAVQNGEPRDPNPKDDLDGERYIRNLRDLAHYVHFDAAYQPFLNACLILLEMNAPRDSGNPYSTSSTEDPFATFGDPHVLGLVAEVATRALRAVWYQKWFVHRRLRPEAYAGLVHMEKTHPGRYPMLPDVLLNASCVKRVDAKQGTFLLPQAFPEGSPVHPAYGAGHATLAGACATVLKAWFDESWGGFHGPSCRCRDGSPASPRVLVANEDGTSLEPPCESECLTIGGELNKLAGNISLGRNAGGVHWRSDYTESVKLGEAVAISVLRDQKATYSEGQSLRLTRFDGRTVQI